MDKVKLGKYIVALRKEKNMTQKDLAEKLHVTVPAVSKWERGLNFPDVVLLEPLAGILNVSVSDLLSQSPSGQSPPEVKEYVQDLIGMAMSNVQKEQKEQKNLTRIIAVGIVIILALTSILIGMVRFIRKTTFQIIRTEYTTSTVSSNSSDGEAQRILEIYVHTQSNITQEEIKEHTDLLYEQWQTGLFSEREIDAIHILYYDSMEKLKIHEGYFHEAYILTH